MSDVDTLKAAEITVEIIPMLHKMDTSELQELLNELKNRDTV